MENEGSKIQYLFKYVDLRDAHILFYGSIKYYYLNMLFKQQIFNENLIKEARKDGKENEG